MQSQAFPYILLLSLFWGTNIVASRFGIGEFDPYLFTTFRLAIATLFFVPISLMNGRRWPTDPNIWRHAVISGILGVTIPMTSFILSLQYQSSGVASIFVTASPAIIVIMAHFILPDEKMTRNKALGLILALLGALFLVLRGESGLADVGRASPLGFILVMLGLVSEAINTMYVRRRMMDIDPIMVTGIRLLIGAVIALAIALLVADFSLTAVTPTGIFSLVYAALIGALAGQFTAFYIQRRFGATAFSLTSYLIPIVATTFGVLLLDEIVTWAMLVGIVLIGSGIYLISKRTAVSVRRMPIR
jgi:drug/metabolite transporter (DMT)-like permease